MKIPVINSVEEMHARSEHLRVSGHRLVLVPTMGALHDGHLALVREARKHGDTVIVSVFVNPTQFGAGEDLKRYPRRLEADLRALSAAGGVEAVFAPSVAEMYPGGTDDDGIQTWVEVSGLTNHLCGPHRPGHFRGVATIVTRLFNATKPHTAVFGRKDAQQFVILRRMVRDLLIDIDVVGVETVREPDGLARSSRNEYLSAEERGQAVVLFDAVTAASRAVREGEQRSGAIVEEMLEKVGKATLARVQYAEVVDAETLQPVAYLESGREVLAAVAVFFGSTRLIDSAFIRVP